MWKINTCMHILLKTKIFYSYIDMHRNKLDMGILLRSLGYQEIFISLIAFSGEQIVQSLTSQDCQIVIDGAAVHTVFQQRVTRYSASNQPVLHLR